MGSWVRRGYYPNWVLRLFRRAYGRCEDRALNEHIVVDGEVGYLAHDFVHEDTKGLTNWIAKHNHYACLQARSRGEAIADNVDGDVPASLWGSRPQRVRWIKRHVWRHLPPLVRPFFYAFYRIVLRGGFLDGWKAIGYHLLHSFWYVLLIELKLIELSAIARPCTSK